MPTVLRYGGYRFFFFSNEGSPLEPMHIHVKRAADDAKIWLVPDVAIADSFGFSAREQNELIRFVAANRLRIEEAWNEYFRNKGPLR